MLPVLLLGKAIWSGLRSVFTHWRSLLLKLIRANNRRKQ
jgi:hypothetical protein